MAIQEFDRITDSVIKNKGVRALPDRPNEANERGGKGLTAGELKEHFDQLAIYLAKKINDLYDVIESADEKPGLLSYIPYDSDITVRDFINSFKDGDAAKGYIGIESAPFSNSSHQTISGSYVPLDKALRLLGEKISGLLEHAVYKEGSADGLTIDGKSLPGLLDGFVTKENAQNEIFISSGGYHGDLNSVFLVVYDAIHEIEDTLENFEKISRYNDWVSGKISAIPNADYEQRGMMSVQDKKALDALCALMQDKDGSVVDAINEVLAVFANYPQGRELADLLSSKAPIERALPAINEGDEGKVATIMDGRWQVTSAPYIEEIVLFEEVILA